MYGQWHPFGSILCILDSLLEPLSSVPGIVVVYFAVGTVLVEWNPDSEPSVVGDCIVVCTDPSCNQLEDCFGRKIKRRTDMILEMLKGKIHRATVKQADLNYVGSITIDRDLMDAAGIIEYEKVQIADVDNGNRFETYVIAGERGSGLICLNGATARCASTGDKVIIMCYCQLDAQEAVTHQPKVVFVDEDNHITKTARYEKHGRISADE